MLRDNLVGLIEPMRNSAGVDPPVLDIRNQKQASDDSSLCLENPRPEGAESSLTENVTSPFQAEPTQQNKAGLPFELLQDETEGAACSAIERIKFLENAATSAG